MNIFGSSYVQIVLGLLSALILFLYAIESLGKEFQEMASEEFRKKISKVVKNRYSGALIGALSTAVVQSSSAITSIAVLLVNTGIISFRNSLGVIFGSSIGTTVTAQLALLSSSAVAPVLIIVGFLSKFAGKRLRLISKPIFFLGVILFSLSLLSSAIEPLKQNPEFVKLFSYLSSPLIAYTASCLFTMLIHSSSITSGIVVVLAQSGVISIEVAIPMILGANLGTSITTIIASSGLNLYARRAGFANFLFKVIGTLLFMIFVKEFILLLQLITNDPAQQAAMGHLIFNVINSVIFLLLLKPFEKLVCLIIRGNEEEILFETKYLHGNGNRKVAEVMGDIRKELAYSIENTIKIYQKAISIFYNPAGIVLMDIQKLETLNDFLDDEITSTIVSISKNKLSEKDAQKTITLVKVSNTIEQIADLGDDFADVFKRMHSLNMDKRDVNIEKLTDIHNRLIGLFRDIEIAIQGSTEQELLQIKEKEEEIYAQIRNEYNIHVSMLQQDEKYNGNIFVDAISIIELSVSKVRDIRKLLLRQARGYPKDA